MSYIGKDVAPQPQGTYSQSEIDTQMLTKAPLASPTFTGTVTATTFSGTLSGNASTTTYAYEAGQASYALYADSASACEQAQRSVNLIGGSPGCIVYQMEQDVTALLEPGTSGYYLKSNGADAPSWDAVATETAWVSNDSRAKTALNASGTAPIYACRAWVNFNGTGTVAIRASGNVSSITDNGVGDYTVNFTTAMPDANYAWSSNSSGGSQGVWGDGSSLPAITNLRIRSAYKNIGLSDAPSYQDMPVITLSIFR
jgi:hypothetical protein